MNVPGARSSRWDMNCVGDTQGLAESFVIAKNENPVLLDGSSRRAAELVPTERGLRKTVEILKVICRVERAVAQELISASVKLIRAGACDRIDDSAGSITIFRRIVAG